MTSDSRDPRIGAILQLVSQLIDDSANDEPQPATEDDLDGMIEGLTALVEQRRSGAKGVRWQSQHMLQRILDHMPSAVFWKDRNSVVMGCNRPGAMMAGLESPEAIVGLTDFDLPNTDPESAAAYRQVDQRVMDTDTPELNFEELALSPNHPPRWLRTSKVPLHDDAGQVIGVLVMFDDITEYKQVEETLRQGVARYRALIESQVDLISCYRPDTTLTFVNDAYCRFYGKTREELIGQSYLTMVAPEFREITRKEAEAMVQDPRPISGEYLNYTADGKEFWIQWVIQGIVDKTGQVVELQAAGRDITRLKQAEAALRDSEFFLQKSQSVGRIGSYYMDARTGQWISSPMLDEIFGLDARFAKDVEGWISVVHPDQQDEMRRYLREHVLTEYKRFEKEYRIIRHTDGQERWLHGLGELEFDEQGNPIKMIGTIQDITERKQTEKAIHQLNAELEQRVAERTAELQLANEEIKNFAYIVSHDLRAPLVNLKGFSGELRMALQEVETECDEVLALINPASREKINQALHQDIPEALRFIESAVENMDGFTKAILKLSRLGRLQLEFVSVDVRSLVERKLQSLAHQVNQRGVTVTIGDLPVIIADHVSMEQIFGNILSNAVAYLAAERPGEIEISAERTDDLTIFRIRDNGRGIAPQDMDKVFAPFRRAGKQDVPGEGMGLAYVQTLVRRHGGRIWFESKVGVGTTFTFTVARNLTKDSKVS